MAKTTSDKSTAYSTMIHEEMRSLVAVLSTADRNVYAFVVACEPPEKLDNEISYRGSAFRWHTDNMTRAQVSVVVEAMERELKRIRELMK